jgi:hypothetical protein
MALTPAQVLEFLQPRFPARESAPADPVAARRVRQIQRIALFLEEQGFPRTESERCRLSLIPFVFQEANYDDIDWTNQRAALGHLEAMFELDFYVASCGLSRAECAVTEFERYVAESLRCIDAWAGRGA